MQTNIKKRNYGACTWTTYPARSDVVAVFLFCFLNSKLFSFKSKSPANESPSSSESSSPKNSAGKIRVLNHKDYNTWKVSYKYFFLNTPIRHVLASYHEDFVHTIVPFSIYYTPEKNTSLWLAKSRPTCTATWTRAIFLLKFFQIALALRLVESSIQT